MHMVLRYGVAGRASELTPRITFRGLAEMINRHAIAYLWRLNEMHRLDAVGLTCRFGVLTYVCTYIHTYQPVVYSVVETVMGLGRMKRTTV